MDGATDGFDQNMEAHLLTGANAALGFVEGNEEFVISSFGPLTGTKTIPVKTYYGGQVGAYKLNFTDLESFPVTQHIYLRVVSTFNVAINSPMHKPEHRLTRNVAKGRSNATT